MIAIAKADTRNYFDGVNWIEVPDIKIPQAVEWSAQAIPGQPAFFLFLEHNGRQEAMLWHGPHTIGAGTYWFVDAPVKLLQKLRSQLGSSAVAKLVTVLRLQNAKGAAVRAYVKAAGFTRVRNSAGKVVGVRAPLEICGHGGGLDLDLQEGEDIDNIEEIPELED